MSRAARLLEQGDYTCAACLGDRVYTARERGVKPLADWLRRGVDLMGFSAADKVVGKAAAFLYVLLGVRCLYAPVLSEPARAVLEKFGVEVTWDTLVPYIINRRGDGMCPFEAAVMELTDPREAQKVIFDKLYKEYSND